MTGEQRYHRLAGYWALPCMAIPLVLLIGLNRTSYGMIFFFGTAGLFLAISGILKGTCGGRICGVFALLTFAWLLLLFLNVSNSY